MKLDRTINNGRRGKYALIKLRETDISATGAHEDRAITVKASAVDFGSEKDFFVIRFRDKFAAAALHAYAEAVAGSGEDPEYAGEVRRLALMAENCPDKKMPD